MQNNYILRFPDNDKKYYCCCGVIHVKVGAIIAGIFMVIGVILSIVVELVPLSFDENLVQIMAIIAVYTVDLFLIGLLFFGLWKMQRYYMIPQIVIMILWAIIVIVFIVYLSVGVIEAFKTDDTEAKLWNSAVTVGYIVGYILNIWFIYILYRCWIYIMDLKEYEDKVNAIRRA